MTSLSQAVLNAANAEQAVKAAAERIGIAAGVGPFTGRDVTGAGRAQRVFDAEDLASYLESIAAHEDALHAP